jgi:hypothetical protein
MEEDRSGQGAQEPRTGRMQVWRRCECGRCLLASGWEAGADARRQIGGSTLHSWSGVGRGQQSLRNLVERIRHSEQAVRRWQETDALIIDESKYILLTSMATAGG